MARSSTYKVETGVKYRGWDKTSRIPARIIEDKPVNLGRKPEWLKIRLPNTTEISRVKSLLRENNLHSVCEEANCPNLAECFSNGTATFMILGDICTRRCPFCDVAHGRPNAADPQEPENLAKTIQNMGLKYVVITSVNRDDMLDGGAKQFAQCIDAIRQLMPDVHIEVLVPDFRGRLDKAMEYLLASPPDVFNHNLESVPSMYKQVRPGADYQLSLDLLQLFKQKKPHIATKSGLMLGLGEDIAEIKQVLRDLRAHDVDMITIGQYLQPSEHHLVLKRYVTPQEFDDLADYCREIGFSQVASGPLVRSSYHAEQQMRAFKEAANQ
jgi:lipoyl synthase